MRQHKIRCSSNLAALIAAILVLLSGSAALADGGGPSFTDLTGYWWANGAISQLAGIGIIQGETATTFDPGGTFTRAQFAALMKRLFGLPEASSSVAFVDVPPSHWAYDSVEALYPYMLSYNVGNGYAFQPDSPVSRIEVADAIGKIEIAEKQLQLPSLAKAQAIWAGFSDGGQVPSQMVQTAATAVSAGLLKGLGDGSFGVDSPMNRAQAAVAAARLLSSAGAVNGQLFAPPSTLLTGIIQVAPNICPGSPNYCLSFGPGSTTVSLDVGGAVRQLPMAAGWTINNTAVPVATQVMADTVVQAKVNGQGAVTNLNILYPVVTDKVSLAGPGYVALAETSYHIPATASIFVIPGEPQPAGTFAPGQTVRLFNGTLSDGTTGIVAAEIVSYLEDSTEYGVVTGNVTSVSANNIYYGASIDVAGNNIDFIGSSLQGLKKDQVVSLQVFGVNVSSATVLTPTVANATVESLGSGTLTLQGGAKYAMDGPVCIFSLKDQMDLGTGGLAAGENVDVYAMTNSAGDAPGVIAILVH